MYFYVLPMSLYTRAQCMIGIVEVRLCAESIWARVGPMLVCMSCMQHLLPQLLYICHVVNNLISSIHYRTGSLLPYGYYFLGIISQCKHFKLSLYIYMP